MKATTLCYIEKDGCYLMLHRTKKEQDVNKGKWIGVGGHIEENESPDECILREVLEETGLILQNCHARGLVTFVSDTFEGEWMHLFTADAFTGTLQECSEGELKWISKEDVPHLRLWEGDRIFLELLTRDIPYFSLKLIYRGDKLTDAVLNGNPITR
ncbi:MAG: 8-oxo-dGTP diphosphatase [Ruminococcaceae bacterium]|nr:8-oxo-dGTP diphosphatase [Oscillospiraceae bacterium]